MRLASFRHQGRDSYGVVRGDRVLDAGVAFGSRWPTLRAALEGNGLDELRAWSHEARDDLAAESVSWLPVIPRPDKILCVGVNYVAHRDETGRSASPYPTLFTRFSNSHVGHGQPLVAPRVSTEFDYEAELAVIIGRAGRHVPRERALELVAGYSAYNDGSVRDWQRHTAQFTPGKNFVASGAFGPWMVTVDEIPDPSQLEVVMRLNGMELQRSRTDLMIFDVPALIAYITTFTELVPGDVISTGTPGGVGSKRTPPVFMKAGDVAEVEVSGVGILRNPVVAER